MNGINITNMFQAGSLVFVACSLLVFAVRRFPTDKWLALPLYFGFFIALVTSITLFAVCALGMSANMKHEFSDYLFTPFIFSCIGLGTVLCTLTAKNIEVKPMSRISLGLLVVLVGLGVTLLQPWFDSEQEGAKAVFQSMKERGISNPVGN